MGICEDHAVEVEFHAITDVGKKRDHNEDNFLVDPKLQLFIVADGMGGHAAGEAASQIATQALCRALRENAELIERYRSGKVTNRVAAWSEISAVFESAIHSASSTVYETGQVDSEKRGMGTTMDALLLVRDRAFYAHVGDSRIYLVRQGTVHQITEDHSLVNMLVKRGKLKPEEFESSPYAKYKNAMTRAVGVNETVEPEMLDFELLPGDCFLLCTDGLHYCLDYDKIVRVIGTGKLDDAAKQFVKLANDGGGHDNITAVIVRVAESSSVEAVQRVADLANRVDVLRGLTFFKHLTYKEIMAVLNLTEVREYQAGEMIFPEGSPGEELFILLGGRVSLRKQASVVATLQRGDHFGEMSLIDQGPRSATVIAEEKTQALLLRRGEFYRIIRNEPPLATKLLWSFVQVLTSRLRKTTADLSGARLDALAERLEAADDGQAPDEMFERTVR